MSDETEDLREVKGFIVLCGKCGGTVMATVKKYLTKETSKEIGKMLLDGCDIQTSNIIIARSHRWCTASLGTVKEGEEPCEGMWPKKSKTKK